MYTLFLISWKRCSQPCQSDLQLNRLGYLAEPVSYLLLQGGIATHSKGFPDYIIQNNSSVGAAIILTEWGRPNQTAMMQCCKEVYAIGKFKEARKCSKKYLHYSSQKTKKYERDDYTNRHRMCPLWALSW